MSILPAWSGPARRKVNFNHSFLSGEGSRYFEKCFPILSRRRTGRTNFMFSSSCQLAGSIEPNISFQGLGASVPIFAPVAKTPTDRNTPASETRPRTVHFVSWINASKDGRGHKKREKEHWRLRHTYTHTHTRKKMHKTFTRLTLSFPMLH